MFWLASRPRAFWAGVFIAIPLAYVASFGAVLRINRAGPGVVKAANVDFWQYRPMFWLMDNGPDGVKSAVREYVQWCLQ